MQQIKVVDYSINNIDTGYVIKLDNLKGISDSFNLGLSEALDKGYYFLERSEFDKAKASSKLCLQLCTYEDSKVNKFIDLINSKEIIYYYQNKDMNIKIISQIMELISNFYNVMAGHHNLVSDDELEEVFKRVKEIKENLKVDFEKTIKAINIDEIYLYELESLDNIFLNYFNNNECLELIDTYHSITSKVNIRIEGFNKLDKKDTRTNIEKMVKYMFEEDFYTSEEFELFISEKRVLKFENYSDLLEEINESYLLYRFNREKDQKLREEILYNLDIFEYFKLNSLYKDYFFESIDKLNKSYLTYKDIKVDISELINSIKSLKNSAIPL